MPSVDSAIVFLPRFTTLAGATTFTTQPMDVSGYGGVQFQIWRGPFRVKSSSPTARFTAFLEESLDTETWVLGPSAPGPHVIEEADIKFFSYSFRLRWFRLRILVEGDEPIVSCWAEGLLRGGGDGVWPGPRDIGAIAGEVGANSRPVTISGGGAEWDVNKWLAWRQYEQALRAWEELVHEVGYVNAGPMPEKPPFQKPRRR